MQQYQRFFRDDRPQVSPYLVAPDDIPSARWRKELAATLSGQPSCDNPSYLPNFFFAISMIMNTSFPPEIKKSELLPMASFPNSEMISNTDANIQRVIKKLLDSRHCGTVITVCYSRVRMYS